MYSGTYHGICSYYLLQNLKSCYERSGQNITQALNVTVRAYTLSEYEYNMQQLDSINGKIMGYLDDVGPERWSRFHIPSNRYSIMTSNIVKHRENAQGTFMTLSSKYEKQIREMSTDMINLRVSLVNQAMFLISDESSSFIVHIENRTCKYRMLQVDQLPCPQALTMFASMKMDPYEYCSYYYTSEV
ncbi:uncharacterized protein LOC111412565 [Olea europaea var. sylvestris]|uniref:uncharacterized protein LOC111412565 n=1 Tax=Olea europaea var. sylvestris TaxID=158386 RepID=UPI000C1CD873|nr:uncharacterized protein LOC111412565 [Olea europaea var. sylvestris]